MNIARQLAMLLRLPTSCRCRRERDVLMPPSAGTPHSWPGFDQAGCGECSPFCFRMRRVPHDPEPA
jgi:hypothetical protein